MKDKLAKLIAGILEEMGIPDPRVVVEVPEDVSHGDYTTNVAMKVWRSPQPPQTPKTPQFRSPMEIALQVAQEVKSQKSKVKSEVRDQNIAKHGHPVSPQLPLSPILSAIDHVDVAPPGFINVFMTEASLISHIQQVLKQKEVVSSPSYFKRGLGGVTKKIMVEFAHPNTHKAFHIGHLRNITTGECIVRLLEAQGHTVIRANYQGDVGLHIAKALYALLHSPLSPPSPQSPLSSRIEFLGKAYAAGSAAFESDEAAKEEIVSLNGLIYAAAQRLAKERGIDPGTTDYLALATAPTHTGGERSSHLRCDQSLLDEVYQLWKETRQWSLDYFETIYQRVGSHYDQYYFESECLAGVDLSRDALKKGVLKKDAGAIIFDGKPYNLDTRVFVNNLGLPTYEGKELALATMETTEHGRLDRIIHVVGPEQASFFAVTFKAEELLGIVRPGVQHHLIYGFVRLKHGKMSSRSGNVVLGEWLLDEAKKAIYGILEKTPSKESSSTSPLSPRSPLSSSQKEDIAQKAAVAAVKYAFLKVGTTSEIAFDIKESVNFQGDSGPYLQYTYARARSVLRKANLDNTPQPPLILRGGEGGVTRLNPEERAVARQILYFSEAVRGAAEALSPSTICTYLFKLAQVFNVFYAKHSILSPDHPNSPNLPNFRIFLTSATAKVLKSGLYLLGIETLEKM